MATDWKIGDRIQNRWEIHKILHGGMGIVYIVYDHEWREALAAKTFQDEVFARNPATAERFTQEALAWVNLDAHQNVTRAGLVEIIQGKPYLFLEYVSGGDLSGWIGTARLTEDLAQALRFAIHFCDGMIHALSKGITAHRDIKPQNCLITEDNTLKVTDFGLAKMFNDTGADEETTDVNHSNISLTRTGVAAGTPTHMAPEQFDDAKHVDVRADIYSFGVMMYQMIEGRLPFVGGTWQEFKRLHKTAEPPTLSGRLSDINAMAQRCLAKSPSDRFSDFVAVRGELAGIYEKLTGKSAPQPVVGKELDANDWNNKGVSLSNLGRHEEAIQYFDRVLKISPRNDVAWTNKGTVLYALGRSEEALACLDQALELNVRFEKAWSNKGAVLAELSRREEALACYDRAIELNPHLEKAWLSKGKALYALGRYDEIVVCCNRAIELNAHHEGAWTNKGAALNALGRSKEAIACYDRAIELNPRYEGAWSNKGNALIALGRGEEALVCFDQAIEINLCCLEAWYNKGNTLYDLGWYDKAVICYYRAIELNPILEKAWCNNGASLCVMGRYDEAIACCDRAIELSPHYAEAWYNKANALNGSGSSEEAIACYDRAIELNSHFNQAWFNKGAVLVNDFQLYREAVVCFEEAHRLGHPKAASVIVQLGPLLRQ